MSYRVSRLRLTLAFAMLIAVGMALWLALPGSALAQGGTIEYGAAVVDEITATTPFVLYGFQGTEGDVVTAYVVGLDSEMLLSLSLLAPNQEQLAFNQNDPFGGGDGSEARVSFRLQETGVYSLLVAEETSGQGEFLLRLNGRPATAGTAIQTNAPLSVSLSGEEPIQSFTFSGDPNEPITLVVGSDPFDPNFLFTAQVYSGEGRLLATLGGEAVQVATLTLAPSPTFYEVLLSSLGSEIDGTVTLLVSTGAPAPQPTAVPPAVATATPTPGGPANICNVVSTVQANVRSGPSTAYPIVAALLPGNFLPVVGRNADSSWWVVDVGGGRQGWISGRITTLGGPCDNLTIFQAPPLPTPVFTATPIPTATPATSVSFTADRYTINLGECATLSWNVQGVREVRYQGTGVPGQGSRQECPSFTTAYNLTVTLLDGTSTTQTVTITVTGGYRITFTSTATTITAGQCVTLSWVVEGVTSVFYQGEGVTGTGARQECPAATTTYVLRVTTNNGQTIDTPVTVTVNPAP